MNNNNFPFIFQVEALPWDGRFQEERIMALELQKPMHFAVAS